jgi:hypothetical protein
MFLKGIAMALFEHWFTHKSVYLLPDSTRVIAYWTTLGNDPRWWFLAEQEEETPLRPSEMILVVYPNGSVYNFLPEMEESRPVLYHPQPSDLCIEDILPLATNIKRVLLESFDSGT